MIDVDFEVDADININYHLKGDFDRLSPHDLRMLRAEVVKELARKAAKFFDEMCGVTDVSVSMTFDRIQFKAQADG